MSFFKSYLKPATKKASKSSNAPERTSNDVIDVVSPPMEMMVTPSEGTPRSSRPPSTHPRNGGRQSVLDAKNDVMVSWMHQQQCSRQLYSGLPYEGVVLKQGRDYFSCAPPEMKSTDLYQNIKEMNVKVRYFASSVLQCLTSCIVCNDCTHALH